MDHKRSRLWSEERRSREVDRRIERHGRDECWPWMGKRHTSGYGSIRVGKSVVYVHRYVFFREHGYWPVVVRHKCDNPPCCNPRHLLPGTQADNLRDRDERGRRNTALGERHGRAKLTAEKVREMRYVHALGGVTYAMLARQYGVTQCVVSTIVRRKSWAHVL